MRHPVLQVQQLSIRFPEAAKPAVSDISFDIWAGETLALVGESGSGKSITSLAIMGLLPTTAIVSGKILYRADEKQEQSVELHPAQMQLLRGRDISMVFQEPMSALNPIMKVGKQLRECFAKRSDKPYVERVSEWFAKVKLPTPTTLGDRYPHQLSGGQKQRVMIAMAMCNYPKILIADEPTTALDASVQTEVLTLMKELQQEMGTALIFITHDLAIAKTMADKVMVMRQGEVIEFGTTKELFLHPQQPYTQALLKTRPKPDSKGYKLPVVQDYILLSRTEWVPQALPPKPLPIAQQPILQVDQLTVKYPARKDGMGRVKEWFAAVDDVSFDVMPHESLGLVGESGSGKSTIGKALVGLAPIQKGIIMYQGQPLYPRSSRSRGAQSLGLQMVFQDAFAALNPRMSVGDMLAEPLLVHTTISKQAVREKVLSLLNVTGLAASSIQKYPHEFSGGQRQRLGIARALAMNPKLLICDESVSALDVSVQAQILNLLNDLKAELNLSFLFITHDLNVVQYFCDRVIVLYRGAIIEQGSGSSFFEQPQQAYTQKLFGK